MTQYPHDPVPEMSWQPFTDPPALSTVCGTHGLSRIWLNADGLTRQAHR